MKYWILLVPIILGIPLFLMGCVSIDLGHIRSHAEPLVRPVTPKTTGYEYAKKDATVSLSRNPLKDSERYRHYIFSLPSYGENSQEGNLVTGEYFESKDPGKKKLVIVLPIYGTGAFPPENTAYNLSVWNPWSDTNVLLLYGEKDLFDWEKIGAARTRTRLEKAIADSVTKLRNTVIDISRLIDWAETRAEIDSKRVGVVGFSISAIMAAISLGVEPRLAAGVVIMGGANFNEIFAFCETGDVATARKKILKNLAWTEKQLADNIKDVTQLVNPARYGGAVNPEKVLMIDSAYDNYIPHSARDDLWNSFGRPERITLKYSHRMAFKTMTLFGLHFTDFAIFNFFRDKL